MPMITIHKGDSTNSELDTNGYGILEVTTCLVDEEINGNFSLNLTVPETSKNARYVLQENIIKVSIPRGYQCFRIMETTNDMGSTSAYCEHISYDLRNRLIKERVALSGKKGNEALPVLLSIITNKNRSLLAFKGSSDIGSTNNITLERCSILAALINQEQNQSFLNRWGGEIYRNNFVFNINHQVGTNRGVKISFAKDLTGFKRKINYLNLATSITPTYLDQNDQVVQGTTIDSNILGKYAQVYEKTIHFADIKIGEKKKDDESVVYTAESAKDEAKRRVDQLFSANIDLPEISADISFVSLAQTEEYKNFEVLNTVELGDTITCIYKDEKIMNRIVSYTWDVCAQKYTNLVIGKVQPTIADSMYAADINTSALSDKMSNTVQLGSKYNDVYINHEEGFVAEAKMKNNDGSTNNYRICVNATQGLIIEKIISSTQKLRLFGIDSITGEISIGNYDSKITQVDTTSVKKGTSYKGITISPESGFRSTATIDNTSYSVAMNSTDGLKLYEGSKVIGGLSKVDGVMSLISSVLMDKENANSYIRLGEFNTSIGAPIHGFTYYGRALKDPGSADTSPFQPIIRFGAWTGNDGKGGEVILMSVDGTFLAFGYQGMRLVDNTGKIIWSTN